MNELPSKPDALPLDMRIAVRHERSPQEKNHLASSSRDTVVRVLMLKLTIWLCYACWHLKIRDFSFSCSNGKTELQTQGLAWTGLSSGLAYVCSRGLSCHSARAPQPMLMQLCASCLLFYLPQRELGLHKEVQSSFASKTGEVHVRRLHPLTMCAWKDSCAKRSS